MIRIVATLVVLLTLTTAQAAAEMHNDVVEDGTPLRVKINGRTVRLESLVVKPTDITGRLPIALIAHGKPGTHGRMSDHHTQLYLLQARDLARRGWLTAVVMRRGYGNSDGPHPVDLTCASTSLQKRFDSDADELEAALTALTQRPDADPTRMLALGASAGGAAVLALSARNPPGLSAVINVSGGLTFQGCDKEDLLVSAMRDYGVRSRVPSLWVYAENDSSFSPELVERMRTEFLEGGGNAKLVMFPSEGTDGHNLFAAAKARIKWLPEVDAFLRSLKLPTWSHADVDMLLQKLNARERSRGFVEQYLAAPSEKALAREKGGDYLADSWGGRALDQVRRSAVEYCQRTKPVCELMMENNRWIGPGM
jgi:dienelactone hydrolase